MKTLQDYTAQEFNALANIAKVEVCTFSDPDNIAGDLMATIGVDEYGDVCGDTLAMEMMYYYGFSFAEVDTFCPVEAAMEMCEKLMWLDYVGNATLKAEIEYHGAYLIVEATCTGEDMWEVVGTRETLDGTVVNTIYPTAAENWNLDNVLDTVGKELQEEVTCSIVEDTFAIL